MLCPVDGETLVMTERSGVEIDYCPKCRGVWLDRGELDKIIERSSREAPLAGRRDDDDDDDDDNRRHFSDHGRSYTGAPPPPPPPHQYPSGQGHYGHPRKRKSFWSELFDD